jgi:septum formation protein
MRIILASASPRRKELLEQIGVTFEVLASTGEEIITKTIPHEIVMELAKQKAGSVVSELAPCGEEVLVIGADTIVAADRRILGKPKDRTHALEMLDLLAGNTHQVYTGVCLIFGTPGNFKTHVFYEKTDVTMYEMSRDEKESYVDTGEPYDKAGGYGIQGKCAIYIKEIKGDYNNVVGLPIARLYQELKTLGLSELIIGKKIQK